MATYGNIPKYHDQNLPGPDLQGLPHILAGIPGLCRVASCDDGYKSRTNVGKNMVNKDLPRCSNATKSLDKTELCGEREMQSETTRKPTSLLLAPLLQRGPGVLAESLTSHSDAWAGPCRGDIIKLSS